MAFSGSRAGHYTPLSADGNESSLLSRDEQVRLARVVREGPPAAAAFATSGTKRTQQRDPARNGVD